MSVILLRGTGRRLVEAISRGVASKALHVADQKGSVTSRKANLRRQAGRVKFMDARRFDKSKLPSRHVTEGPARAPHRSYFYAMGISEEEIHQPWVGVATCWNEAA